LRSASADFSKFGSVGTTEMRSSTTLALEPFFEGGGELE
jgi:hypothetical protein